MKINSVLLKAFEGFSVSVFYFLDKFQFKNTIKFVLFTKFLSKKNNSLYLLWLLNF